MSSRDLRLFFCAPTPPLPLLICFVMGFLMFHFSLTLSSRRLFVRELLLSKRDEKICFSVQLFLTKKVKEKKHICVVSWQNIHTDKQEEGFMLFARKILPPVKKM